MQNPKTIYLKALAEHGYHTDPSQEKIIDYLDQVYSDLIKKKYRHKYWHWLVSKFISRQSPTKGLYLWGNVGVGKTWLMDIFYESLPFPRKMRMHFHRFMRLMHQELKRLQGKPNPLNIVAKKIAQDTPVICFDEFFVSDIADAMILGNVLNALFSNGVCLVATSNVAPDDLYRDGLQRNLFLPAIKAIKENTEVIHAAQHTDYRLRTLEQAGIYFTPLNDDNRQQMRHYFEKLADKGFKQNELLIVEGRGINTVRLGQGIVWFRFLDLCSIPRSQMDYLEIAKSFHTVFVSNVPQIQAEESTLAQYLINLVDVFYDAQVKLIISAAVPIEEIYLQGSLDFEFKRTKSRLFEMQSLEYLQRPHLY